MEAAAQNLWTIRSLAKRLGVKWYVLKYAVDLHDIPARARVGTTRVFSDADMPAIEAALKATGERSHRRKLRPTAAVPEFAGAADVH